MKLEIKTTAKLLDEFHNVWGKESDFVTKSDYIDKDKYKKWVSVESLLEKKMVWYSDYKDKPKENIILLSEEDVKELEEK